MPTFGNKSSSWQIDHISNTTDIQNSTYNYNHDEISIISNSESSVEKLSYSKSTVQNETPEEMKQRKRSHWVAYITVSVMTIGFSVAISGVWPYLQLLDPSLSKTSLGWTIAANPLGQLIASPIFGYFSNKLGSIRYVCYITMTFYICGNLIYSFLPAMTNFWKHSAFHIMIISRFIIGISSANITLCRTYIASSTTIKERTVSMAILSGAQSLGFIIGPALQTILVLSINKDMLKYRSSGWVAAVIGAFNLCLLTPYFFKEFTITENEKNEEQPEITSSMNGGKLPKRLNKNSKKVKPDMPSVIGILTSYFFSMLIFIFMETLSVPLLTDQYAWEDGFAVVAVGIMTLISAVFAIGMIVMIRKLVKVFDERKLLLFIGYIPIALGTFLYMPIYTDLPITISNCTTSIKYNSTFDVNKEASHYGNYPFFDGMREYLLNSKHVPYNTELESNLTVGIEVEECTPGCPESQEWCKYVSKIPYWQFGTANILIIIGFPVSTALSISLYSKAVGQRPQGLWMALVAVVLCISRIIGPISASYIYTNFGTVISFGVLTVGMIIGVISYASIHKRL